MHETMGLSGMDCLWILGKPYNLGGLGPDGPKSIVDGLWNLLLLM